MIIYEAFLSHIGNLVSPSARLPKLYQLHTVKSFKVFQLNSSNRRMINKFEILTLIHFPASSARNYNKEPFKCLNSSSQLSTTHYCCAAVSMWEIIFACRIINLSIMLSFLPNLSPYVKIWVSSSLCVFSRKWKWLFPLSLSLRRFTDTLSCELLEIFMRERVWKGLKNSNQIPYIFSCGER